MPRDKQNKLPQQLLSLLLFFTLTLVNIPLCAHLSSLAKNDALPMYTTLNIDEELLLTKEQLLYKDYDWAEKKRSRGIFSFSPFAQNADRGKTIKGQQQNNLIAPPGTVLIDTPLGDLTGRTGMIALLYGAIPQGQTLAPALVTAKNALFPGSIGQVVNDEAKIDPDQLFGFFSFPETYRKRGVAAQLAVRFADNFGFYIQGRVSTIRQVSEDTIDLTDENGSFEGLSGAEVDLYLMDELHTIADQIGINLCDFIKTSIEEVRFNLFWRQAFEINKEAQSDWAKFLIIPYVEVGASVSPGKKDNEHMFFAAPFGNNGHPSVGFTTGVNFDFLETIEIGGEVGYTHFFTRSFCRPIPNSEFQTNLFPFSTNVSVSPGDNWFFGARIAAYHFIDKLSMYFEWFVLDHQQDDIDLKKPDPAFLPKVLECTTSFKTKLGNAGFNYDLSPNVGVGFLWQIPFSQRNSYRSSTLMASLNVTF
ncbi:MAG TPA: hypothetical protein VLB80_04260 [Candidatus Babeliales bacterium]|nr:hypothetical protein [Candidatus Babeliales bacterium]